MLEVCLLYPNTIYKAFHNLEEPSSEGKLHISWWESAQFLNVNRLPALGKGRGLDMHFLGRQCGSRVNKGESEQGFIKQREQSSQKG